MKRPCQTGQALRDEVSRTSVMVMSFTRRGADDDRNHKVEYIALGDTQYFAAAAFSYYYLIQIETRVFYYVYFIDISVYLLESVF